MGSGNKLNKVVTNQLVEELKNFLDVDRVSQNSTVLEQHSKDESYHTPSLPDVVVFPKTKEEVSQIMKLATKYETAVVPFGIGSSLEGHVIPLKHGVSIDFTRMNEIVEVREKDLLVKVQPGVTRTQLNKALKKYGLFFPIDPGADATLGGMAATSASGTTSVRYGTMRDQVQNLEIVLADGTIVHTGNLAVKSSSGYHLNSLFVGSEGTLGCFTELTLKVYGIPEFTIAHRAVFTNFEDAVEAVTVIRQTGIPVARVEFVDVESIRVVNKFEGTNFPELPTLFFEFQGNKSGLMEDVKLTKQILDDFHCVDFLQETDNAKRNQLWKVRHNMAYSFIHMYRDRKLMSTDVAVPISELAGAITFGEHILKDSGLPGGIVGHVGDGNFHICLMINPNHSEDIERANYLNEKIVEYALAKGGTCTGEHGVGIGKKKYQQQEHGQSLEIMKKIKAALDPKGILNPGKIL
ncbi:FAD-binding oxidoreductase [Bacillus andreraoultii]|uniref:FAD-binding oxidoreductase n=1 Tax=Bacillus andreraoultii TaxID=1499685 RepID=UPI00053A6FF3|nr:FAD-linked oxidase C-terminal domain-containing protein [Bacillus andreraoultii]